MNNIDKEREELKIIAMKALDEKNFCDNEVVLHDKTIDIYKSQIQFYLLIFLWGIIAGFTASVFMPGDQNSKSMLLSSFITGFCGIIAAFIQRSEKNENNDDRKIWFLEDNIYVCSS